MDVVEACKAKVAELVDEYFPSYHITQTQHELDEFNSRILKIINDFNGWAGSVHIVKKKAPYYEKGGTLYCSTCGTVVGDKDDEYLFPKDKAEAVK